MIGIELPAAALLYTLASAPACAPFKRPQVEVTLEAKEPPITTDFPIEALTEMYSGDPDSTLSTEKGWKTGGLTKSMLSVSLNVQFDGMQDGKTGEVCLGVESLRYTVHYDPHIYVAAQYLNKKCRYAQVLAHERRHVKTDLYAIRRYLPDMKAQLARHAATFRPLDPFPPAQTEERQQQILKDAQAVVEPYLNRLIELRRREQAKLDTEENYLREAAMCPGE